MSKVCPKFVQCLTMSKFCPNFFIIWTKFGQNVQYLSKFCREMSKNFKHWTKLGQIIVQSLSIFCPTINPDLYSQAVSTICPTFVHLLSNSLNNLATFEYVQCLSKYCLCPMFVQPLSN